MSPRAWSVFVVLAASAASHPAWAAPAGPSTAISAAAPPAEAASGMAVDIPGTSSTIRMLLELQAADATTTPAKPLRVATPSSPADRPMPPVAALDGDDEAQAPVVMPMSASADTETEPEMRAGWQSPSAVDSGVSDGAARTTPARAADDGVMSAPRRFINYLREHRTAVFAIGLAVLAATAAATIVQARRRSTARRSLTATQSPPRRDPRRRRHRSSTLSRASAGPADGRSAG